MKHKVITLSLFAIFCASCSKNAPEAAPEKKQEIIKTSQKTKTINSDDCFKLQANKKYTFDNDDETEIQITPTTFNNQSAMSIIRQSNGIRTDYIYDLTGRTLLANLDYGIAALGSDPENVLVTTTYQNPLPTFPSNIKPQQNFQMTYKSILQSDTDDSTTEHLEVLDMQFIGFEDLTLIDQDENKLNFKNTCHFTTHLDGDTLDEWYAEGYGQIKYVRTKANGDIKISEAIGYAPEP